VLAAPQFSSPSLGDFFHDVDGAIRVTPLVVIPTDDLHGLALRHRAQRVENARMRIADDVAADDRLVAVGQDALQGALGGGLDRGVDLVLGHFLLQVGHQIDTTTGDDRDAEGVAVQLAVEFGDDLADGLGGAGGRRDDVLGRGAGPTHIAVNLVADVLVVGIAVHRDHQALLDTERIVQDFAQRGQAVRRATGVGDALGRSGDGLVVDAQHHGGVDIVLGRDGQDDLLGAGFDVVHITALGRLFLAEDAGGLDGDRNAHVLPGQFGRVTHGDDLDLLAVDHQALVIGRNGAAPAAHHGVVLEQVGQCLGIGQIVDGDQFQLALPLKNNPRDRSTDSPETVDSYLCCHRSFSLPDSYKCQCVSKAVRHLPPRERAHTNGLL